MSNSHIRPVIRRAVRADDAVLAELDRRIWSPLHAVLPGPSPEGDPFFDATHLPSHFLVAEYEAGASPGAPPEAPPARGGRRRIAGYVRLVTPTPLPANAHVRQIQGLAVDLWARGRGIARALLDAACAEARRQGALRITLRVLGHNTPARRLYESAGFVVEGVLPAEFLIAGEYVDDVLMGRRLAD
ncbi:GNAT family N-acetyltransferase [Streptomyces sp. KR80]|uniref:GNAT family N-acetyltransferase n=1 Tax=Streptomyces sp. KR80 TaxID=3457426 RepID=UPI003FD09E1A